MPITKRQLGLAFLGTGLLGGAGILVLNVVRSHNQGVGPAQILGIAGCFVLVLVGLTLFPLGDRPA